MVLCQKSFEIRDKKNQKEEQAEVDNVETIYEDEQDDAGNFLDEGEDIGESEDEWDEAEEDEDCDLYETILDSIDEVLFFRDKLNNLQNINPNQWNQVISCLDQNGQNAL